ncbi:hypothetical protein Tco_1147432 [Tanacetum coccineum]
MPYPRFTKVIINHFISKDKTISMKNMINLHTIHDDSLLDTLKFVSKTQDYQQYGALIHDDMINHDIKDSKDYKAYYEFSTKKVPPRKARKYKKVTSPSRELSPVKEAKPVKKAKRVKRPAKKSTTAPTAAGVVIRDTPGVSVSKKKAPAKADRSKVIEILSNVALSEAAQLKEATKRSKKDFHISQASGSGDGTDFESGVPSEQQRKTSSTNEGTGTKPGIPDVPKYQSKSDDESWGDSEDDNDDINDDDEDDDNEYEDDDGNDAHDSERSDSDDDDENPSFTLKDYDEEEHDEEYESDDDNENVLKKRMMICIKMWIKFLIFDNVPPVVDEVASMMNVKNCQEESSTRAPSLFTVPETAIPETSIAHATTVPPTITMITPLPQLTTPSPALTTVPTTTSIPVLLDFSSLFRFDQRVSTLEKKLSRLKQTDHSTQLLVSVKYQLPTMVDNLLSTRIGYATRTAL